MPFYSSLAAAIILRALSIPIVVVLSSIAQLLATVWNCCAHASAKWSSSVFMHVSVNDFNFHSSVLDVQLHPGSYRYSQKSSDPLSAPDVSCSQVIFLFFLFSFIQLVDFCHYCATLRCFDTRIPRCHSHNFGEPLVLNNINRSTAFCNPFGN